MVKWASTDAAAAIERLWVAIVLPTAGGLFAVLKWLHGRRIAGRQPDGEGNVTYTRDDGSTLTVPEETAVLYDNITVRRRAREVVEPLYQEGVEQVTITRETDEAITFTKDDLPAFEGWDDDGPPVVEQETDMLLEVAAVAFKPNNKWRFSLGRRRSSPASLIPSFSRGCRKGKNHSARGTYCGAGSASPRRNLQAGYPPTGRSPKC